MKAFATAQRGVGLIEVLIAVLVLAVGLLGVAGLQLTALRNNQSAMERSMGVVQSYSIIEAIRADPDSAKNGRFNVAIDSDPSGDTFPAQSLITWRDQLKASMGDSAVGSVACNSDTCTVIVRWDDSRGLDGSASQEITTEVQL